MEPTVDRICTGLNSDQQLKTMFSENYVPVNCRSSLEGVWQFAYQNRFRFTGECNHPDAYIRSCQMAGTQFLITNQKFNITYKRCDGLAGTFDGCELISKSLFYPGLIFLQWSSIAAWALGLWRRTTFLPWPTRKSLERTKSTAAS